MTDSNREAVGLVGLQCLANAEQAFNHVLHLVLAGRAGADDRLLDLARGIFGDFESGLVTRTNRRAPRLSEFQCRIGVTRHEYVFDPHLLGPVLPDYRFYLGEYVSQALRQAIAADLDTAAVKILHAGRVVVD